MDTLLSQVKTQSLCSLSSIHWSKNSSIGSLLLPQTCKFAAAACNSDGCLRLRQSWPNGELAKTKCAKGGFVSDLEDEIKLEEEFLGMVRLKENCRETNGTAELLECLEREAIMGEDEGREPNDYNRRAQIFDKSSRVFQALKERDSPQQHS